MTTRKVTITVLALVLSTVSWAGNLIELKTPVAVNTFESSGITCPFQNDDNKNAVCQVKYRIKGNNQWQAGFPLWRDDKRQEFRGSLVKLKPDTLYEVKLEVADPDGSVPAKIFTVKTWSEKFPIAKTVVISGKALNDGYLISESGNAKGYILYKTAPGAVIDVANRKATCITVAAHHIIIRGMTLKGAKSHAIRISSGSDIIIEQCDISNWGSKLKDGWAKNMDCAVYSNHRPLARVIIQRNKIHHPRYNSNNWKEPRPASNNNPHPAGAQAVGFWDSTGNHVIRYNHVYSDPDHYYNDIFGCGANFSEKGFPNANTDIYGNILEHCWDDAIETEGANNNVRVWGNYIENAYKAHASRATSVGPLYIWRNVCIIGYRNPNIQKGAAFHKSGGYRGRWDNGVFVFHNSAIMPSGKKVAGSATRGIEGAMLYTMTANNILNVEKSIISEIRKKKSNRLLNDLCSGKNYGMGFVKTVTSIKGNPKFTAKFGINRKTGKGVFYQTPASPGYNRGIKLPGFNSDVPDGKPDLGAHEADTPPMEFGPKAFLRQ